MAPLGSPWLFPAPLGFIPKAEAGKDLADNDGATPVFIAALMGHLAVVQALLKANADKDKAMRTASSTFPLLHAARGQPSGSGKTLLHASAINGHADVVKALLASRADPDVRDRTGETPLDAITMVDKDFTGETYTGVCWNVPSRFLLYTRDGSQAVRGVGSNPYGPFRITGTRTSNDDMETLGFEIIVINNNGMFPVSLTWDVTARTLTGKDSVLDTEAHFELDPIAAKAEDICDPDWLADVEEKRQAVMEILLAASSEHDRASSGF